ncbi:BLUF domain-containing protein [Palleronia sp. LCG004]|uniref:BLUF domain-containing protein n=1 Tax=Palleronia sp. LCG004 TaxID=3079304 RepID=UPI002941CD90|nr:BLUF domain-containing protein [Palleronia sp. LCG004]WOI55519.1 BLUF domain-containing protein [Palleronia sp. LCG004]
MVYRWMYISRATTSEGSLDDVGIYLKSRGRNRDLCITGFLHRECDHYAQYIEGETESILRLRSLIMQDPRHTDLRILAQGVMTPRLFAGWEMAYASRGALGFSEFHRDLGRKRDLSVATLSETLCYMQMATADGQAVDVMRRFPDRRRM